MKYEMCESVGLKVFESHDRSLKVVNADDVEALLKAGTVLYGDRLSDSDNIYTARREERDRSYGILVGKQPIENPKKPVTRKEVEDCYKNSIAFTASEQLLKRILTDGYQSELNKDKTEGK